MRKNGRVFFLRLLARAPLIFSVGIFALAIAFAAICVRAQQPAPKNNPTRLEQNPIASLPTPTPSPQQQRQAAPVDVRFIGTAHFRENQLRPAIADQIQAIGEQGLTPALADDAAFFLGIFYRKNGYSQVDVKWRIDGARRLALIVAEGPFTTLGAIDFSGVKGLSEATLRDYVIGTTRERFPRTKAALPFVQSDVDTGVERIRGLYLSEGFLDSIVDPPQISFNADKTRADVLVTVREGTRYRFGKIDFEGDIVFYHAGEPDEILLKQVEPFRKRPYTPAQVTNMQRAVVYFYKTHGYFDPKIEVESDPKNADSSGAVPVTFHVESGNVYRFDGVTQEGLDRLSAKFLPNRFRDLNGKFYNPQLLDDKFREMMRTGLFRQLHIEPRALPNDTIELHLKVEEAKAKELGFSVGYGTFEGPIIGFSAGDHDLLGTGRPLTSNIEISQRIMRGEIVYSDPWLFESDYSLRTRLYAQSQNLKGYSTLETGLRGELSRKLTKQLEATAFLWTKKVAVTDLGIQREMLGPTNYLLNSVGTALTLDLRDSPINPTRGFVGNVTGDFAGNVAGSQIEFLRGTARFSYYLPVTQKTMLALGARAGELYPLSGDRLGVPIDERFFNGGSRSVRSFPERELGPRDQHGYPIGGDTFSTFNVEYQFPVVGDLLGAIFFDAGSVGRDPGSLGEMRYGIGAGVRYRSPVGPLRIDVGVNPAPKYQEPWGAVQISFGTAF